MNKNFYILLIIFAVSVGAQILFRENKIVEGNTTISETPVEENQESEDNQQPPSDEPEPNSCKAVVDNSVHSGLCNKQSYKNSEFNTGCAVYTGKNDGDIECYADCCDLKTEQDLDNNKRFAAFQKEIHGCQDAQNYADSLVCKAIDNLAESRRANTTLPEESSVSDFNPDVDESTPVENDGEVLSTQNQTEATTSCTNAECRAESSPDRASSLTREANVTTGFFTSRPSGWPFAGNSYAYDNHLTGCNCPPCSEYKNPNQVL